MFDRIRRTLSALRGNTCGNAALLVAMGLPSLVGGAGFAVDTAQWYMWKRELQFAVDQAALAGAWARSSTATQTTYQTRAQQEYTANLQKTAGFADTAPTVSLSNYGVGVGNAVRVQATASKRLPFSSLLTGDDVTVAVEAQASFSQGGTYGGCLTAVAPNGVGFTLGGNASGSATCGVIILSTAELSAIQNGNSGAQFGTITSAGGISGDLADNAILAAYTTGLGDPFGSVTTPTGSSVSQTYSCPTASAGSPGTTVTTATVLTRTLVQDKQYSGTRSNSQTTLVSTTLVSDNTPPAVVGMTVTNGSVNGNQAPYPAVSTSAGSVTSTGSGGSRVYFRTDRVTSVYRTYSLVTPVTTGYVAAIDGIARPQPGTYDTINIDCETRFAPGIYVVNDIDFGQNKKVIATDVMFVVQNANGMHINSNSDLDLSGITSNTLQTTYGYTSADATTIAGMLFFDRNSTEQIKINGNATVKFNGTIYTPNRPLWFNGTAAVSGYCMMLVGNTLTFTGNINFNAFCQPAGASLPIAGNSSPSVKLVA
jgi:Flp pilus assembly protein TadG